MTAERGFIYPSSPVQGSPADLVAGLRDEGWLPADESWWFGWNDLDIQLPSRLRELDPLAGGWEVLHLFSPLAEFRQRRRGTAWQIHLLAERPLPQALAGRWGRPRAFRVVPSWRLLAGGSLTLPAPGGGPPQPGRGDVILPRPLDYDLEGEGAERHREAVVAEVYHYQDDASRLQTVRYRRLAHRSPDDPALQVQPFALARALSAIQEGG